MPTPSKKMENTTKHWTKAEKERREKAEQGLRRDNVRLTMPKRVKEDAVAAGYWKVTLKRMKGLELLDDVDTDLLAGYCVAYAQVEALRKEYYEIREKTDSTIARTLEKVISQEYADEDYPVRVLRACVSNELAVLKALQGQERLVISYAKELGLTPNARQRLAKRLADEEPSDETDGLYD